MRRRILYILRSIIQFSFSPSSLSFSNGLEQLTITIISQSGYTVVDYPEWVNVSSETNKIIVLSTINSGEERNGYITIKDNRKNENHQISISLEGKDVYTITPSKSSISFTYSGGTNTSSSLTLTKNSNPVTDYSNVTVTSSPSWCTVSINSTTGVITITATSTGYSSRSGDIVLSYQDVQTTISVSLSAKPDDYTITSSKSSMSFSYLGGSSTSTISLKKNGSTSMTDYSNVTVSSNQSWCTTSLSSQGVLTVTTTQNSNTSSRSATITLSYRNATSKTISVYQGGTMGTGTVNVYDSDRVGWTLTCNGETRTGTGNSIEYFYDLYVYLDYSVSLSTNNSAYDGDYSTVSGGGSTSVSITARTTGTTLIYVTFDGSYVSGVTVSCSNGSSATTNSSGYATFTGKYTDTRYTYSASYGGDSGSVKVYGGSNGTIALETLVDYYLIASPSSETWSASDTSTTLFKIYRKDRNNSSYSVDVTSSVTFSNNLSYFSITLSSSYISIWPKQQNTTYSDYSENASFYDSTSGESVSISLTLSGKVHTLDVKAVSSLGGSSTISTVDYTGGSGTFYVYYSYDGGSWTLAPLSSMSVYSNDSAVTLSKGSSAGYVNFTVAADNTYYNYPYILHNNLGVTVTYNGLTNGAGYTILQTTRLHTYSIVASPGSADYTQSGGTTSLSHVYLYIDGVKQNTDIKNSCTLGTSYIHSWITISGTSWTVSSYSTYESTRTGTITVSYDYNGRTLYDLIDISQSGPEHTYSLEVSPNSDSYLYNGGTRSLDSAYLYIDGVKQNTDIKSSCTLSSNKNWITINGTSWTVTSYNEYDKDRQGDVTVSYNYNGQTLTDTVSVTQSGKSHTYGISWDSPSDANYSISSTSSGSDGGSTFKYSITQDGSAATDYSSVSVSSSESWLTVKLYPSLKDIDISWTANTGSERSATITVTYHDKSITATITQVGVATTGTVILNCTNNIGGWNYTANSTSATAGENEYSLTLDITPGTYRSGVYKEGYVYVLFDEFTISAGETKTFNFTLTPTPKVTLSVNIYKNGSRSTDAELLLTGPNGNELEAIDGGSLELEQNTTYQYEVFPNSGVSFQSIIFYNSYDGTVTSGTNTGDITSGTSNMSVNIYLSS